MSSQIRASHILLSTDSLSKEDALAAIEAVHKEISDGKDFADVARDISDCPSGSSGGDLGSFGKGSMVPEFETAAFELDVDAMSGPVETSFGYHLIQRTE